MEIDFEDFSKVDIRIGKVLEAEMVEGSDKLIKQTVDFGELGEKTILSGIKEWYKPDDIVGKSLPYVVNLKTRKIMGIESEGMLLAAGPVTDDGKTAVLIIPDKDLPPGTKVT